MSYTSITPEEIVRFYVDEVGVAGWYVQSDDLDQQITSRYLDLWEAARAKQLAHWMQTRIGTLALIIVLDQFPRNMFRKDGRAFVTDPQARKVAKYAMTRGDDMATQGVARMLYYMPLMHAECNADQDASVRAFMSRLDSPDNLVHARAHREVIRKYGRFPTRNAMMGRQSSAAELDYLNAGGYGAIVQSLSPAA